MTPIEAQAADFIDAARAAAARGDVARALNLATQAVALRREPEYLEVLGQLQLMVGQATAAAATLQDAVTARPQSVLARQALALSLQHMPGSQATWQAAIDHYRVVIALDPANGDAYLNLAIMRHTMAEPHPAVARCLHFAAILMPQSPQVWGNASSIHYDRGVFAQAAAASRKAMCLAPSTPEIVHGFAETVAIQGDALAIATWFDRLVGLDPASMVFRVTRAKERLAAGDFVGGWADYEARRGWPGSGLPPAVPGDSDPQPLAGKSVMVYAEQGFGDVLQFAAFVPRLCARAASVFLVVPPELVPVFAGFPDCGNRLTVIEPSQAAHLRPDLALPIMSLARLMDNQIDGAPYLRPSRRQQERWAEALRALPGLRVGVAWSGNPRPDAPVVTRMTDYRRSIPLALFGPALACIEGVSLVSLQHGYRVDEVPGAYGIRDASAYIRDFSDLAGLIANLDLVVTVDTAVAHLAGALGARTWMLNRFDSCWRWERGATTTRWYRSMRIFPQVRPMSWTEPLSDVVTALAELSQRR